MTRVPLLRPGALISLAFFLILWPPLQVSAEREEALVRAEGKGVILKGDRASARERAVRRALDRALEKASEGLLGAEALLSRTEALEAQVLSKSEAYVLGYRIIEEGPVLGGRIWHVELEARIDLRALKEALFQMEALEPKPSKPQLLVLVEEHLLGLGPAGALSRKEGGRGMSEGAIIERLSQAGIFSLDSLSIGGEENLKLAREALGGSTEAALALGKSLGVSLVLLGSATAQKGSGRDEFQGIITARLLRVATGEVLAMHTLGVTVAFSIGEEGLGLALKEAGAAVAERIKPEIKEALSPGPRLKKP
ncbi:MAG: hypothetical protein ACE5LX_07415 [Nitrospinota bacterium]